MCEVSLAGRKHSDRSESVLLSKQMVTDSGRGEAAKWRPLPLEVEVGAGDETRTRDPLLGKQMLQD